MNLSEANRSQVYNELADATSPMTAEVMMQQVIDAPWRDLATKGQLSVTEQQLDTKIDTVAERLDAKIDAVAERLDSKIDNIAMRLDAKIDMVAARTDATIEGAMRRQTIWLMTAMFTFNSLLAAWLTAPH